MRIDEPQGDNEELVQEIKDIEVTHSSYPLIVQSDGWLQTVDGELLTYVPNEHCAGVCDMSVMCIPDDANGHPVRLDWNGVHNAWDNIKTMME